MLWCNTGKEEGRKSRITVTCNGMQKECHPSDGDNQLKSGLVTLISDNRHQLSIPKRGNRTQTSGNKVRSFSSKSSNWQFMLIHFDHLGCFSQSPGSFDFLSVFFFPPNRSLSTEIHAALKIIKWWPRHKRKVRFSFSYWCQSDLIQYPLLVDQIRIKK